MRFTFFPSSSSWRANPYLNLLQAALEQQGAQFVDMGSDYLTWQGLFRHKGQVDVLHFHWTQYQYVRASQMDTLLRLSKFGAKLVLARTLGYRIVWTMHNALPHELTYPALDYFARLVVAHLSQSVIVHCEEGRQQLWRRFRRFRKIFSIPFGNYIAAYTNTITRMEARRKLNIKSNHLVFLCFGAIRPYKGVELLLEEFATMPGEDLILLIVGAVHLQDLRERILALGEGDNRIRIVPEFIAPNDVQCYFNAADAVVLPFVEILSSSSAIVALSFGRPVIAPAVGCLPDLVTEDIGVLYDRREPHALRTALERCLTLDLETMGRSGYARVQQYTWERVAARTLQAYQE